MASGDGRAQRWRAVVLVLVATTLVGHGAFGAARGPSTGAVRSTAAGCDQSAFVARDARQEHTFTWVMNVDSVPAYLDRYAAVAAVRQATATVAHAHTPCPLGGAEAVLPATIYTGPTRRQANVTRDVACFPSDRSDGISVVSFGDLPDDVVAVTCSYSHRGDIWQSDVMLNDGPGLFTLHPEGAACSQSYDLQAVMTHERGHSFGLAHVPEGPGTDQLTMSSFMGVCDLSARTLGAGDVVGLREIY